MIKLIQQEKQLEIRIEANLLNTSTMLIDLEVLKTSIVKQLHNAFNVSIGKCQLHISISITGLKSVNQCSPHKILFQVVDATHHNTITYLVLVPNVNNCFFIFIGLIYNKLSL